MRKIIIVLIIILFYANTAVSCEMIIRITERDYPPFFMKDKNGRMSGLSVELAQALLDQAGCTYTFKPLPFKRGLMSLETGKIHLMLNLSINEQRKEYTHFIGPQMDETVNMVIRKDSVFTLASFEDMKKLPKKIGIERGKYYGKTFEIKRTSDESFSNRLYICDNDQISNEIRLEKGLISGFLAYGYNAYHKLKTDPLYKDFTLHPFIIQQDWVYFGFSKKGVSPSKLQELEKVFEKAKEKAIFEKIRQNYMIR